MDQTQIIANQLDKLIQNSIQNKVNSVGKNVSNIDMIDFRTIALMFIPINARKGFDIVQKPDWIKSNDKKVENTKK